MRFVYDPTGKTTNISRKISKRVSSLAGLRLGVLNNGKWNAGTLLDQISTLLGNSTKFAQINRYKKESFTRVADPELLKKIASENDIALIAIGD